MPSQQHGWHVARMLALLLVLVAMPGTFAYISGPVRQQNVLELVEFASPSPPVTQFAQSTLMRQTLPCSALWVTVNGLDPSIRSGITVVNETHCGFESLVVFGGQETDELGYVAREDTNSTWLLDRGVHSYWTPCKPTVAPSARRGHVFTHVSGEGFSDIGVLLFGGTFSSLFDDVWRFDLPCSWTKLEPTGYKPSARIFHSIATLGNSVFASGGCGILVDNNWCVKKADDHDALLELDVSANVWRKWTSTTSDFKGGLIFASLTTMPNRYPDTIFLFGGRNLADESTSCLLWRFDLGPGNTFTPTLLIDLAIDYPFMAIQGRSVMFAVDSMLFLMGSAATQISMGNTVSVAFDVATNNTFNIAQDSTTTENWPVHFSHLDLLGGLFAFAAPNAAPMGFLLGPMHNVWSGEATKVFGFVGYISKGVPYLEFSDQRSRPNPWPRMGHTASLLPGSRQFFIFGGFTSRVSALTWRLDLSTSPSQWSPIVPATSQVPTPRFYHRTIEVDGDTYVFGGAYALPLCMNDVWRIHYDRVTDTLEWLQVNYTGSWAGAAGFSMTCEAFDAATATQYCFLWGGDCNGTALDDLYSVRFHKQQVHIERVSNPDIAPSARSHHATFTYGNIIYLFAGLVRGEVQGQRTLKDFWKYNRDTREWTLLQPSRGHSHPPQRYLTCSMAASRTKWLIYGGRNEETVLDDLWEFDAITERWTQLHLRAGSGVLFPQVSARWGPVCLIIDDYVYIHGGISSTGDYFHTTVKVRPQCNPGSGVGPFDSYMNGSCVACTTSEFYSPVQSRCLPCPFGTMASVSGAETCTVCSPDFCHHNRPCSVEREGPVCRCGSAFSGERCQHRLVLYGFLAVFGVAAIALAILYLRQKKNKALQLAELNQQLLADKEVEFEEIVRVFRIQEGEIHLEHRIDGDSPGAFGDVWKGRFQGHSVAVKRLKVAVMEMDEESVQQFDAEVRFMRSIRHKNIVFFYGAGVTSQQVPFLVTEFCDRGSLFSILKDESIVLTLERKWQFLNDICQGMVLLHSLSPPCIHRDLKSMNVLCRSDWTLQISDFGTAKLMQHLCGEEEFSRVSFQAKDSQTFLTNTQGTLRWCAPEILRGGIYHLGADVYSYGMVAFEIATRQLPFDTTGASSFSLRQKILDGIRPSIPETVPQALQQLITSCWAAEPSARPPFTTIDRLLQESKHSLLRTDDIAV
eukprot:m.302008 g.302008  ORF g.302008 m.302008 type:complete len:1197 (+) comp15885_c0_seq1:112-3702(+)